MTEGKKAAEGSSLSSDVFSPSVRTAIGQFILMKSIFRLLIPHPKLSADGR